MSETKKQSGVSAVLSTDGLEICGYKFERIDDFEIRMESPAGEAWRLRYADKNDGFARFIWDFAEAVTSNAG